MRNNTTFSKIELLYWISGVLPLIEVVIFLNPNHWYFITSITKISLTFIMAFAAYAAGMIFSIEKRTEFTISLFYLIFAFITPFGFYALLEALGLKMGSYEEKSCIYIIMLIISLVSLVFLKENIFILISTAFGTKLF